MYLLKNQKLQNKAIYQYKNETMCNAMSCCSQIHHVRCAAVWFDAGQQWREQNQQWWMCMEQSGRADMTTSLYLLPSAMSCMRWAMLLRQVIWPVRRRRRAQALNLPHVILRSTHVTVDSIIWFGCTATNYCGKQWWLWGHSTTARLSWPLLRIISRTTVPERLFLCNS